MGRVLEAYDALVQCGGKDEHAAVIVEMRAHFCERTGDFGPEHDFFEARSRAFWDDALSGQGLGERLAAEIPEAHREGAVAIARAARGLFRVAPIEQGYHLTDEWNGARFFVASPPDGLRDALLRAEGYVDGRVAATLESHETLILPGALFHPADAIEAIDQLMVIARERGLSTQTFLDSLLTMERNLRAHSRVKAKYAYRPEALAQGS